MTIDTIEELRAELRDCLFTSAERRALEAELADLVRQRQQLITADDTPRADQSVPTAGA